MAINVTANKPDELLESFKNAIRTEKVLTWALDADGDFTHTATQWKNMAWMRPEIQSGNLKFYIIKPLNKSITTEIYAIYHGRLIETLLAHCDSLFSQISASSMPENGFDQIS